MTPLTVNRTRSKNSLLGQKEKKKRNSNLNLASRKEKPNLNLASLSLISSILFYLVHHFRITVRSTDEQNCISWNPVYPRYSIRDTQ